MAKHRACRPLSVPLGPPQVLGGISRSDYSDRVLESWDQVISQGLVVGIRFQLCNVDITVQKSSDIHGQDQQYFTPSGETRSG